MFPVLEQLRYTTYQRRCHIRDNDRRRPPAHGCVIKFHTILCISSARTRKGLEKAQNTWLSHRHRHHHPPNWEKTALLSAGNTQKNLRMPTKKLQELPREMTQVSGDGQLRVAAS